LQLRSGFCSFAVLLFALCISCNSIEKKEENKPFAISVLSKEDAETANMEALSFYEMENDVRKDYPFVSRKLYQDNFKTSRNWRIPSYWSGQLSFEKDEQGVNMLKLVGTQRGNDAFGRCCSKVIKESFPKQTAVRITVAAKGEGTFSTGLLIYHSDGRNEYLNDKLKFKLSEEYRSYETYLVLPFSTTQVLPYCEAVDTSVLIVKDFLLESLADPAIDIHASTPLNIIAPEEKQLAETTANFTTNKQGDIFFANVSDIEKRNAVDTIVITDHSGHATIRTGQLEPGCIYEISLHKRGCEGLEYVITEDSSEHYAFSDSLAKQIKIDRKCNILFIGDSLSDFYRGYNYIDRLSFWLNKYNHGKVSFRNVGVGGDFTTRTLERLNAATGNGRPAYRQSMYDDLFQEKYNYVFIFLGHNDTTATSERDFKSPTIEPEVQYKEMKEIITIIQKNAPEAKVVLISPSPCQTEEINRTKLEKWDKESHVSLFGIRELIDGFDSVNRHICEEMNLDYIDITTSMREANDKSFYRPNDGVHLSPAGGRFIADRLLEYFITQ